MITINKEQEKNISLKIKTLVVDPDDLDGVDDEIVQLLQQIIDDDIPSIKELEDAMGEEGREEMELCTDAVLRINADGLVEIEYPENEDDEQMSTISKILFHPESPELVSMTKEGAIHTYLSFEAGRTHICTYDTPFMPFKVYVESHTVDNRLLSDGTMHLNYILTFGDTPPRHFIVDIELAQADSEEPELKRE